MRSTALAYVSPEEYLAAESASPMRSEYVNGQVFAMTGGTLRHNTIAGNVLVALRQHLKGAPCSVFMGDVKLRVAQDNAFYYPDVMVICDTTLPGDAQVVETPVLIVEVLSATTEAIDRREKLLSYRRLPSLKEYVLVAQDTCRVEIYRREGDAWRWIAIEAADREVEFASVNVTLPLAELYAGTEISLLNQAQAPAGVAK